MPAACVRQGAALDVLLEGAALTAALVLEDRACTSAAQCITLGRGQALAAVGYATCIAVLSVLLCYIAECFAVLQGVLCTLLCCVYCCAVLSGLVQGVYNILTSWKWLKQLQSTALNFEGPESPVVRSGVAPLPLPQYVRHCVCLRLRLRPSQ